MSYREARSAIEEAENSSVHILVHGRDLVIAGSEEAIRRHAGTILRLRDDINRRTERRAWAALFRRLVQPHPARSAQESRQMIAGAISLFIATPSVRLEGWMIILQYFEFH
jgi:hypothetical protein